MKGAIGSGSQAREPAKQPGGRPGRAQRARAAAPSGGAWQGRRLQRRLWHLSQREGYGDDVGGGAAQVHESGVDHALRGGWFVCVLGGAGLPGRGPACVGTAGSALTPSGSFLISRAQPGPSLGRRRWHAGGLAAGGGGPGLAHHARVVLQDDGPVGGVGDRVQGAQLSGLQGRGGAGLGEGCGSSAAQFLAAHR